MAEEDNIEPIEVKTSSKSAKDLEAEIAATAAALGEVQTTAEATPPPAAPAASLAPAAAAPAEPKVQIKKRKSLNPSAPAAKPAKKVATESEETKVEVKVKKAAPSQSAKVIAPISKEASTASAEPAPPPEKKPETPKPEKKTIAEIASGGDSASEDSSESKKEAKKEDSSDSSEAARKLNALSGELKQKAEDKEKATDQQAAKVFDTKQYHLPIKASHHHRRSSIPIWAWVLIFITAIVGALGYAYSNDIIDPEEWFSSSVSDEQVEASPVVDIVEDEATTSQLNEDLPVAPEEEIEAVTIQEDRFSIVLDETWQTIEPVADAGTTTYRYEQGGNSYIELRFISEGSSIESGDFNVFTPYALSQTGTSLVFAEPSTSECVLNFTEEDDNCSVEGLELTVFGNRSASDTGGSLSETLTLHAGLIYSEDPDSLNINDIREIFTTVELSVDSLSVEEPVAEDDSTEDL